MKKNIGKTVGFFLLAITLISFGCAEKSTSDHDSSSNTTINNGGTTDSDGDGVPDTTDGCPYDPAKVVPGLCGCGQVDIDNNHDGVCDYIVDLCPTDPLKTAPGLCGCGYADVDNDHDGHCDTNGDDVCLGYNDNIDSDSDTVPDGCDVCEGFNDYIDIDGDGIPYGCDVRDNGPYFKYTWNWLANYDSVVYTNCCICQSDWCYYSTDDLVSSGLYNEFLCDVNPVSIVDGGCYISVQLTEPSIPPSSGLSCTTTGGTSGGGYLLTNERWAPAGSDYLGFCFITNGTPVPSLSTTGNPADEIILPHYSDEFPSGVTEVIGLLNGGTDGDVDIIVEVRLDTDGDGYYNACPTPPGTCVPDNCILVPNADQADILAPFGVGDACHDGIAPDDADNNGYWD